MVVITAVYTLVMFSYVEKCKLFNVSFEQDSNEGGTFK